jgi:hypothetical protein
MQSRLTGDNLQKPEKPASLWDLVNIPGQSLKGLRPRKGFLMSKKLLAAIVLSAMLAFGLTACGGGTTNTSSSGSGSQAVPTSSEPVELTVVESGYDVSTSGYLHYAVCIENTNAKKAAEYPVITVVGKDASGAILFSDDWTLGEILPGEKAYYANQAGNGTAPETVEFTVTTDSKKWKDADTYPAGIYTIESTNYTPGNYGMDNFTGQITMTQDNDDFEKPMIVVVLRDADGNIIAGYNTYLRSELVKDKPATFELNAYNPPEFASFEIYANPWM